MPSLPTPEAEGATPPPLPPGLPLLGEVSLNEAGYVAFVHLILRGYVERAVHLLKTGNTEELESLAIGMESTLESSTPYLAAARKMAKWIALSMETGSEPWEKS